MNNFFEKTLLALIVIVLVIFVFIRLEDKEERVNTIEKIESKKTKVEAEKKEKNPINTHASVEKKTLTTEKNISKENNLTEIKELKFCKKTMKTSFKNKKYILNNKGEIESIENYNKSNGELESISYITYDDNGNVLKSVMKDQNGEVTYTIENEYNSDNKIISKRRSYDKEGGSNFVTFEYNDRGDLIREVIYIDGELKADIDVVYTYDENGMLKSKYYKRNLETDLLLVDPKYLTREYKYNKKGDKLEEYIPGYQELIKYEYDKNSRIIKEVSFITDRNRKIKKEYNTIWYTYDKNGNLIKKIDSDGDILFQAEYELCKDNPLNQ